MGSILVDFSELHMKVVVSTLGFDEKFALRALIAHRPRRFYAVALYTNEDAWRRILKAFSQLKLVASQLGVEAELVRIDYRGEGLSVLAGKIKMLLEGYAENADRLVLVLTGGPRILVSAALVAAIALPRRLAERIAVRLEGEGFEAVIVEPLLNIVPVPLDDTARRIVRLLLQALLEGRGVGPTEVSQELGIPKSTAYKKLQELVAMGLASYDPRSRSYRATERAYINA
ncbi:helix-turn-helix domain-containing protein [Hyperthermus butylicus]|uniref:HTH iclR-type domain-containing protein n=1 Tax=Hyperthermus butylicus (strain DSM 5456 / JCM 9403 / PLM1-5) TaxID=415426 RepID=A2BKJ2_HYPBU|nr:helix-turn-helix domain-containing protein [Hyperthermus butylicus]ABM80503.1 hypothetical protein Hbut_0646 [Hyperthermus butylicus DSM 5456]